MGLKADMAFGVEPVTVGDVTKDLDVCGLADELYDASQAVPEDTPPIKLAVLEGAAVNGVLGKHGFPAIPGHAAAYKFAQEVLFRAVALGKAAGDVWRTEDEPASPSDSPASA